MARQHQRVQQRPEDQEQAEADDEAPGTADRRDAVGQSLAIGLAVIEQAVESPSGAWGPRRREPTRKRMAAFMDHLVRPRLRGGRVIRTCQFAPMPERAVFRLWSLSDMISSKGWAEYSGWNRMAARPGAAPDQSAQS